MFKVFKKRKTRKELIEEIEYLKRIAVPVYLETEKQKVEKLLVNGSITLFNPTSIPIEDRIEMMKSDMEQRILKELINRGFLKYTEGHSESFALGPEIISTLEILAVKPTEGVYKNE